MIAEIDVDELARRLDAGATLLDVREVDEYREAHVPGAVLLPLSELPDRIEDVPAAGGGSPLLVICRSGGRSMRAAELLATAGIEAVNVAGGTTAWMSSGRDVIIGEERG